MCPAGAQYISDRCEQYRKLRKNGAASGSRILDRGNFTEQDSKKDDEELVVTTVDGDVEPLEESVPTSSQQPQEQKEEASQQTNAQPAETQQAAPTEAEQILAQGYYVVQSGDSLESISTKIYGNTSRVAKIKEINNIENADNIIIGQKLLLP